VMIVFMINRFLGVGINSGLIALALSNMAGIAGALGEISYSMADLEQGMQSVERLLQYSFLPAEELPESKAEPVPEEWPAHGTIEFKNYSARYRPELPLVLKNVSFKINHGEKIGIVGRTGSGKSTTLLSLFRIINPAEGSIIIDGINTMDMKLSSIRSALTIIPQEPTLFTGTVRYNIDPCNQYSDEQIWNALRLAHMDKVIKEVDGELMGQVSEGGENFSVGQRQLICMVRALLRHSKIICMDEATASIDVQTDCLIQEMIRTQFTDCTIITVAHRLHTIMDSDRVIAMKDGKVAEFDKPLTLIKKHPQGLFASMVFATNDASLIDIAEGRLTITDALIANDAKRKKKEKLLQ